MFETRLTGWTDGSVSSYPAWATSPPSWPPAWPRAPPGSCLGSPPCRKPADLRRRGWGLWQGRSSARWWSWRTGCAATPRGTSARCPCPSLSGGSTGRRGGRKGTSKRCRICIWKKVIIGQYLFGQSSDMTWVGPPTRKYLEVGMKDHPGACFWFNLC